MAITWITGWEHGALSTSGSSSNGAGIVDSIIGSPSVQGTIKRTGNYALECGGVAAAAVHKYGFGTNCIVGRFYFHKTTDPGSDWAILWMENSGDYQQFVFGIESDGDIFAQVAGGTKQTYSSASDDTWYRLDFEFDSSTTTGTIDWQIDGAAQVQATNTITAGTLDKLRLGAEYSAFGNGESFFFDDIIFSDATGDYPFGVGQIVGVSPTGDGTHNNPNDYLEENGGNAIDGSSYFAWSELDALPMTNDAEYVQQTDIDTDDYVEVTFADPASVGTVNGVYGVLSYSSADTDANDGACKTIDSESTLTTIYDGDMSEGSLFYKSALITEPGGGWSSAEVNALKARVGYSSDATPDPYWQGLILEVDYVPSTGYTLVCDAGVYAITGAVLAPIHDKKVATVAGSYAITGAALAPKHDKKIGAAAGTYAVTGAAMSPLVDRKLACDGGTYVITGAAASLTYSAGVSAIYGDGWHMFQMMSQN